MRIALLFTLVAFATTFLAAAPIYQPNFHGPKPLKEHVQHVKHVDDQGNVVYIHDLSDHRPGKYNGLLYNAYKHV